MGGGLRVWWGRWANKQIKSVWHDTCHDRAINRVWWEQRSSSVSQTIRWWLVAECHQHRSFIWFSQRWPTQHGRTFFKSIVGMCRLVLFSCENMNYWIFLKIQKVWHPWAHISIWQGFGGLMMEALFGRGSCSPSYSPLAPQHCGCCWLPLAIKLPALFPCHKVTRELKYFLYPSPSNLEQWKIHWEGTMLWERKGESKFLCRYDPHLLGKPITSVQRDITIEDILGK